MRSITPVVTERGPLICIYLNFYFTESWVTNLLGMLESFFLYSSIIISFLVPFTIELLVHIRTQ
jgi:hypothetical protein